MTAPRTLDVANNLVTAWNVAHRPGDRVTVGRISVERSTVRWFAKGTWELAPDYWLFHGDDPLDSWWRERGSVVARTSLSWACPRPQPAMWSPATGGVPGQRCRLR